MLCLSREASTVRDYQPLLLVTMELAIRAQVADLCSTLPLQLRIRTVTYLAHYQPTARVERKFLGVNEGQRGLSKLQAPGLGGPFGLDTVRD